MAGSDKSNSLRSELRPAGAEKVSFTERAAQAALFFLAKGFRLNRGEAFLNEVPILHRPRDRAKWRYLHRETRRAPHRRGHNNFRRENRSGRIEK